MNVYEIGNMGEKLSANRYPGRGIVLGLTPDGKEAVAAYFIMGRSVNSRNRIFEETDDGIITKAHDESLMTDPHLIIYAPVRALPGGEYCLIAGERRLMACRKLGWQNIPAILWEKDDSAAE